MTLRVRRDRELRVERPLEVWLILGVQGALSAQRNTCVRKYHKH
jgi:hypothetical protein